MSQLTSSYFNLPIPSTVPLPTPGDVMVSTFQDLNYNPGYTFTSMNSSQSVGLYTLTGTSPIYLTTDGSTEVVWAGGRDFENPTPILLSSNVVGYPSVSTQNSWPPPPGITGATGIYLPQTVYSNNCYQVDVSLVSGNTPEGTFYIFEQNVNTFPRIIYQDESSEQYQLTLLPMTPTTIPHPSANPPYFIDVATYQGITALQIYVDAEFNINYIMTPNFYSQTKLPSVTLYGQFPGLECGDSNREIIFAPDASFVEVPAKELRDVGIDPFGFGRFLKVTLSDFVGEEPINAFSPIVINEFPLNDQVILVSPEGTTILSVIVSSEGDLQILERSTGVVQVIYGDKVATYLSYGTVYSIE